MRAISALICGPIKKRAGFVEALLVFSNARSLMA
jgi:hypothetical protein